MDLRETKTLSLEETARILGEIEQTISNELCNLLPKLPHLHPEMHRKTKKAGHFTYPILTINNRTHPICEFSVDAPPNWPGSVGCVIYDYSQKDLIIQTARNLGEKMNCDIPIILRL